jgi:uncharacterized protein YecE (DUF72 family)
MPDLRVGISGWRYPPWRGVFYPKKLAQRRELEYASGQVNSVEINGSFYSLQTPESYQRWFDQTPDDFLFAVKGSRFITHMKKLKDVQTPLANFLASGLLRLKHKLGPILWQFPAQMPFVPERFRDFLQLLPRDTKEAAMLARRHDARLEGRAWSRIDRNRPIRHAFEVRHPQAITPEFVALLRAHGAGLVFADTAGKFPYSEDVTADFIYIRLHGSKQLYASGYDDDELHRWAARIRTWSAGREPRDARRAAPRDATPRSGRDCYVYFDNDVKVYAPFNAMRLAEMLGLCGAGGPQRRSPDPVAHEPRARWPGATRRRSAK